LLLKKERIDQAVQESQKRTDGVLTRNSVNVGNERTFPRLQNLSKTNLHGPSMELRTPEKRKWQKKIKGIIEGKERNEKYGVGENVFKQIS